MSDSNRLRIAVQKSGRLSDKSISLLRAIGIKLAIQDRLLMAHSTNMPVDLMRVRDDDIPGLIMDGVVDLGFIGENELEEKMLEREAAGKNNQYITLRKLHYGGCRLAIAVPSEFDYQSIHSLANKTIATTYPHLLERYCRQQGVDIQVVTLTGSVEVAPRAGLADAICDLVSSGATLEANGLREQAAVFESKAVLIQRAKPLEPAKQALVDTLLPRIKGVLQAKESKYIMLHAPADRLPEVTALLPGAENPTVMPLANEQGQVAIHVVSPEDLFWETMEKLKALGCSAILVLPIEKMMG